MSKIATRRALENSYSGNRLSILKSLIQRNPLDSFSFFSVLVFSAFIALERYTLVASAGTLEWDSASFLANAGLYAGYQQYSQAYDPTRPPFIPFLLSILFRLTGPTAVEGFAISAILYALSIVGCYLIARQVMSPLFALLSSVSFGLVPAVYEWSGVVVSDVEGVGIAALAFATLTYAVKGKRNSVLYLLALPLLILAPLTRYSLAVIILVSVIFLLTSGNLGKIFDYFHFYYGFGISLLVFVVVGWQWISYPFFNHLRLAILFPSPDLVNPFHSDLGRWFYAINMPQELGYGDYGILIFFALVASFILILISHFSNKSVSPIIWAMLVWLVSMLVYYSFFWPYADLRYSIEFAMPGIILAFWAISKIPNAFNARGERFDGKGEKSQHLIVTATIALLVSMVAIQAGSSVYQNTPLLEKSLNQGMKEAVAWIEGDVSPTVAIESNWYTLLWWYSPQYSITPAPLAYQLQSSADYRLWMQTLQKDDIGYVVYVNPDQISIPATLSPVFNSSVGNVVIYQVIGSHTA